MVFWKTPRRCSKESNSANRIIPQSAFLRARVHRTVIEVLHPVALCQLWRWQLHHLSMGQDSVREPYIILIYFEGYFQYVFVCVFGNCAIEYFWLSIGHWPSQVLIQVTTMATKDSPALIQFCMTCFMRALPVRFLSSPRRTTGPKWGWTSTPLENGDWDGLDLGKEKVQFGFSMSRIFDWCRVFP